ncbi:UvrD-helicase-domain-containing protein [Aspergillus pseudodeflectus]|uniref:DNA 3'-5' helicase n=1 Tax=Aspergillus pseudodeflectus TaxID=176178 RepID=A0ABR4L2T8_9EURO
MDSIDPILNGLNTAQKTAVTSPASVLQVLAPPGSGKTKTLTSRVAYLLSHHGYRPQDVICCTFTIKASREMRERLAKLVGDQVQSRLILGTFHSICRRYLVVYGHLIGLRRGFGIADSGDSSAIIARIVKRLKLGIDPKVARSRISHQKAHGNSPEEAAAKTNKGGKVLEQREFVQVYQEYEKELATSNLLDYDDLLLRCAELLRKHPECVSNIQVVLVDEFQDTNQIQYELMNLLASRNRRITVVGDPDQSIYGFRSAEIKNLSRMQKLYSNTEIVLLEDNYRSSGSILSSAQDVIEQDTSRPSKKLQPTHTFGTLPVLRKLPSAHAEAQWIALEIKRCVGMTGKLLKYSDFAILLRSAPLSRQIESAMGKHGIPYRMVGGKRFFDRVEIKLLLDYLRVVSHPENTEALLRIINEPSRKIGEETKKSLLNSAEKAGKPFWDYIKDVAQGRKSTDKPLMKPAYQGLCALLRECTDSSAPRRILDILIERLSFRGYLTATYGSNDENKWANVEELLGLADDAIASEEQDVRDESLPEIEGLAQGKAHPGEEALSQFLANVALSTEEQEKGLEWPVVFVPAVYEGSIPHSRAEDLDEERRLLYVAMTRAQALLYLSCPLRQARNNEETTRLRTVGPKLFEKIIYGIADILRRERPSAEAMFDDQWTEDGQELPDAPFAKRRRYDQEHFSTATTVTSMSSAYTMNGTSFMTPTTMSLGFSTAREYIATAPAKQEPSMESDRGAKRKPSVGISSGCQPSAAQKSISSFFGQPAPQTSVLPQSRSPATGFSAPSISLSNYIRHRAPTQHFHPPRPILEPSDPNRYTWLTASKPAEKPALHSAQLNRGTNADESHRGVVTRMRPATTFHMTTMSMVQSGGTTVRRTLGIRRSMNGWEERMKKAK